MSVALLLSEKRRRLAGGVRGSAGRVPEADQPAGLQPGRRDRIIWRKAARSESIL